MWKLLLFWMVDQKSIVAISASVIIFSITLILKYQYDTLWVWGVVLSFLLGVIGLINVND